MADSDAHGVRAGKTDSVMARGRRSPGIAGYARELYHPAYERLVKSEDLLRRLVPVLIVLFLVIVASVRWMQNNSMGGEILEANKAEMYFIAELLETRLASASAGETSSETAMAMQNLLNDNVAARYLKKGRQVLLTSQNGIIIAALPFREAMIGTHLNASIGNSLLLSVFGEAASTQDVTLRDGSSAIAVHRILPSPLGGVTLLQPRSQMLADWRLNLSINVMLFVGTASILLVVLYAYFAQDTRAREADEIYSTTQLRFDTALSRARCGLWDWDIARGRIYWSDSMHEMLGHKSENNIVGFRTVSDLVHPEDPDLYAIAELVLAENAEAIDKVFRMRNADGDWLWLRMRAQVVRNERAEPHLIGIAIDVTEQETIRQRTRRISTRLHDSIENLSEAFVLWDNRNRLVMCNTKFQQLHGLDPELAIPGTPHEELMRNTTISLAATEMLPGPDDAGSRSYEVQLKDGRWLQINERRTRDGGYVSVGNDITAIKRHEAKLIDSEARLRATVADLKSSRKTLELQAKQLEDLADNLAREKARAEQASQAKSDFLANMSHELRTPLNAVIGFSDIMLNEMFGELGSEKYHEYCRDIHDSGTFLLGVINDILDMSKIEAGRLNLDYEEIRINDIIEETLRIIAREAEQKNITIKDELMSDLTIHADRRAVKQILLNLLSNAVKFSRQDGMVFVRARFVSKCLRISIEDKGIGISREDLARLGRPFEQAQNQLTRNHKGSGLGLAISRSLAEMHGGALKIRSHANKGTIVSLQLPLKPPGRFQPDTQEAA